MFGGVEGRDALPDILGMIEKGEPVAPQHRPPVTTPDVDWLAAVFWELHLSRQAGFGPCAILYSEVEAWQRLIGKRLMPWQVRLLKLLDGLYLSAAGEASRRK